ncbi:methyltransferase At1g22800 [Chlorella sorokiniana]|uniref:Methyltransferase At1g22800 n=1 Tax=Chlorella sorokiniana TaxID=3076 RepID=A0A2P6TZA1_CHLSO|nr:methyltransferase At1g22800 [Chlorella sorokiniana]|eukprot:PRW59398.1 methyltransferase At1g22800 [Chlorella sorokiniana]
MLERARSHAAASSSGRAHPPTRYVHWQPDSEVLPLEPSGADLVISCLGMHWVNDVPGVMFQCRHALKPDGLFLAAMFGGQTLQELRIACTVAQQEREGGVSARVSPLAQVRDGGNLLTRAGLAIPAVDVDEVQVHYRDPVQLVEHLRSMGESNALLKRRLGLPRSVALATAAAYTSLFAEEDGSIPATYEVIYMTGWAPHPSQQKAAKRGSATVSFEDLVADLGTEGSDGGTKSGSGGGGDNSGGSTPPTASNE